MVKFTKELKYNAIEEWRAHYVKYAQLKKLIYGEEKHQVAKTTTSGRKSGELSRHSSDFARRSGDFSRQSGDLTRPSGDVEELLEPILEEGSNKAFVQLLDDELERIHTFYLAKERELFDRLDSILQQAKQEELKGDGQHGGESRRAQHSPMQHTHGSMADLHAEVQSASFWSQESNAQVLAKREQLREEMQVLYVYLDGLARFIELNCEGFRKALKKHDKVLAGLGQTLLKDNYMPIVALKCCQRNRPLVEAATRKLLSQYAIMACGGDGEVALSELKRRLGERVTFERNTVFKDMVERDRRHVNVQIAQEGALGWWQRCRQPCAIALSVCVLVVLLNLHTFDRPEQNACAALLAFVSLLWCTEALPLFVTSMLVPLLTVLLRVLVDASDPQHPHRLTPKQAAPRIFHAMFSQVIMLLLGGFAIAGALSKHNIAKTLASSVLSRVGQGPGLVLLANMLMATFVSMWISNVAAPVLCFSLVEPILRTLDAKHSYAKSLVMGIALASNLGGMTSPISSPQNLFAIERMSLGGNAPSWAAWFAVALPVALTGCGLCWLLLRLLYRDAEFTQVRQVPAVKDPFSAKQIYIMGISVLTVGLWCFNSKLQVYTGEMGVIAILPLVAFFGFGILNKDDWNSLLWNVVMLAMGGLALGEAVTSSGLLLEITRHLQSLVGDLGLWGVAAVFCALVLCATTFISHTVGAIIILPIVQAVGSQLEDPHPKLLVMAAALMCSGAMGLPVSGFPNMTAVSLEDSKGLNYVSTIDFLKVGILGSFMAYGLILTLGYSIMMLIGW